jgi:type IV pilus assembly protein PilO
MVNVFNKISKIPKGQKIAAASMIVGLCAVAFYYLAYDPLVTEFGKVSSEKGRLLTEKAEYEKRKVEYLTFRTEVQGLLEEQRELQRILPKRDEIPTFLEGIHNQAEVVGLDIGSFVRAGEVPMEMVVKVPVRMDVRGTYHQIARFFKQVADLRRIVSIEDLRLGGPTRSGQSVLLAATFVAATYRLRDQPPPAPPPAPGH